jgi:hypothetical protein
VKSESRSKSKFKKPLEKVRLAILADRMKTSEEEAEISAETITLDLAKVLDITETSIKTEVEFFGRELDLIFTISKQNKPAKK